MTRKLNAPPTISRLHGEERRAALLDRDRAHREAFEEVYRRNGMTTAQRLAQWVRGCFRR